MRFIKQAAEVLNEQRKSKRRLAVFMCLAAVVAVGTAAALKMYGQAMSHKEKRLICTVEAHQHTDGCYDGNRLVCGQADYLVHTHNDDCYGADGSLVCHLPEIAAHTHTDACYTEEEVLVCTEQEQAHQHSAACYTPERGDLQCQIEEHAHDENCYDSETGELICQMQEHQHDDACYIWNEVLTCTAGGHQHGSDCYTREKGALQCQIEEHAHDDSCYDENGELVCQMEEHIHDDNCYAWEDVLTCQQEEGPAGHTHMDACYEKRKVLTCGQLELHTHGESCYDENNALTCGLLELKEHTHQEECFETVELTDEEVAVKLEQEKTEDAFRGEHSGSVSGDSVSGDEAGSVSGDKSDEGPAIIKTFENEKYIVTAVYHEDANIPEEAELTAEIITAENGGDHYAEREAELRKTLGDESVSMNALLKIGFYVDDQEIEPESDVTVTVQFLDEDGLAEGSPIAVVHFAEEGSQILDGGNVKDKSTTFKTNSFSEFGYAEGVEVEKGQLKEEPPKSQETDVSGNKQPETKDTEKKDTETKAPETKQSSDDEIPVSQTYNYRDEAYHITFYIEGNAKIPRSKDDVPKTISFGDVDTIVGAEDTQPADTSASENTNIATSENIDTVTSENKDEDDTDAEQEPRSLTLDPDVEEETKRSTNKSPSEEGAENTNSDDDDEEEKGTESTIEGEDIAGGEAIEGESGSANSGETKELDFDVRLLDEDSEKYQAINAYAEDMDIVNTLSNMRAFEFSLKDGEEALNLDECVVTAHIEPTEKLLKNQSGIELSVLDVTDEGEVSELDSAALNTQERTMTVALNNNSAGVYSTVNTQFTVQYYANLKVPKTAGIPNINDKSVQIIDTSASINGGSPTLPTNGVTPQSMYLYLEKTDSPVTGPNMEETKHAVTYETVMQEIYAEGTYDISTFPEIKNFNKFEVDKPHYKLVKVQEKTGLGENDWKDYPVTVQLTNNSEVKAEDEDNVILIQKGSIIRLVADPTDGTYGNGATFYDYDITDGTVYSDPELTTKVEKNLKGQKVYTSILRKGINSTGNYDNDDAAPRYGFGNHARAGSGLDNDERDGNKINVANANSFSDCSFGLVENSLNNGLPNFTVNAPDLFSGDDITGKTVLSDYSLDFRRNGDTYTLSSVKDILGNKLSTAQDLENFQWRWGYLKKRKLWSNLFWPMDASETFGTDNHDLKFGKDGLQNAVGNGPNSPQSFNLTDEGGVEHNCYFGMSFSVKFDLTGLDDYRGPLNYYFFGDDDMWVFLDGQQLVCDIGGVHGSVGEYVNLWDYLGEKKTVNGKEVITLKEGAAREHTLYFFYTERGASGSCCWMQFTLPSVASGPVNQPTGDSRTNLIVGKTVQGEIADPDASYEFVMTLRGKDGKELTNYYGYDILDKDDNPIPNAGGSIKSGDTFSLKHQQSIVVNRLPDGATYTVKEKQYSGYVANINGAISANGMATGTIDWKNGQELDYINQPITYELPETGGPGPIIYTIAGVFCFMFGAGFMYRKSLKERRR